MPTLGVRGGLSVDHLVVAGARARFDELGGPGLFAAAGARLVDGVDVRVSTVLPDDDPRFAETFDRLGVDRSACAHTDRATRLWILNAREGRRIVSTASPSAAVEIESAGAAPAPGVAAVADEDEEQPSDPRFFAGLDALLDSSPSRRSAASSSTRVGVDPHQVLLQRGGVDHLRDLVPPGGVLLPSRVQLTLVDPDAARAAHRLASELGVPVFARLDREGILVVDAGAARAWVVRDVRVEVVETTGAGDSSAAAIMAALALGADLVTAAMFGVGVARVALAGWGASALLDAPSFTSPPAGVTADQER